MKRNKAIALAGLLFALSAIPGHGELITFAFRGTVARVDILANGMDEFNFPDVGDQFGGRYTFDSSVESFPNPPGDGLSYFPPPQGSVSTEIGDLQFFGPALSMSTYSDFYGVGSSIPSIELTSNAALARILNRVNFELRISKNSLLDDPTMLPLEPPSLVGADQATLFMRMDSSTNFSPIPYVVIAAALDSLVRVPEPASGSLAMLCALLGTRRGALQ